VVPLFLFGSFVRSLCTVHVIIINDDRVGGRENKGLVLLLVLPQGIHSTARRKKEREVIFLLIGENDTNPNRIKIKNKFDDIRTLVSLPLCFLFTTSVAAVYGLVSFPLIT